MLDSQCIEEVKFHYLAFIDSTKRHGFDFALTPHAEATPYARCFTIFGYALLRKDLNVIADILAERMFSDLNEFRKKRILSGNSLGNDKLYLQLLTFTLSALSILGKLETFSLRDHILPLLSNRVGVELVKSR